MIRLSLLISIFMLVARLCAADSLAEEGPQEIPLGTGHDSITQENLFICLDVDKSGITNAAPGAHPQATTTLEVKYNQSFESSVREQVSSNGGNLHYGGLGITGSQDYGTTIAESRFAANAKISETVLLDNAEQMFKQPSIKPQFLRYLNTPAGYIKFRANCGDEFLMERHYGGQFVATYSFVSTSRSVQDQAKSDVQTAFKKNGDSLGWNANNKSSASNLTKTTSMDCGFFDKGPLGTIPSCDLDAVVMYIHDFPDSVVKLGGGHLPVLDGFKGYEILFDKIPAGWLLGKQIYDEKLKPLHQLYIALRTFRADIEYAAKADPGQFPPISKAYLSGFDQQIGEDIEKVADAARDCEAAVPTKGLNAPCQAPSTMTPWAPAPLEETWNVVPTNVVHPVRINNAYPVPGLPNAANACQAWYPVVTNDSRDAKVLLLRGKFISGNSGVQGPMAGHTNYRIRRPDHSIAVQAIFPDGGFVTVPAGTSVDMVTTDCERDNSEDNRIGSAQYELVPRMFQNDDGTGHKIDGLPMNWNGEPSAKMLQDQISGIPFKGLGSLR